MNLNEIEVAKVNDLKDGEMKSVSVGEGKEILLTKINGNYNALGANCTHYSAPLADGVLCNGIIMCPWHHACFDAKTGNLLDPPARDSLPKYETKIVGDDVIVLVPDELEFSRTPEMVKADSSDKRNYVILGGGASGNAAAQSLREGGYTGKITMITDENRVPYDRPNLSKDYLSGEALPEWMPLRGEDFYKENGIEILFNTRVNEVNISSKKVITRDKEIGYDKILFASGGIPRKLNIPRSDFKNIFYLRSFDDSDKIIEACKDASKVVVIGASFIGMEVAHSLHERKLNVTVVAPEEVPFENVFGKEIGTLIKNIHEGDGIEFKLNSHVAKFEGNEKVNSVVLSTGEKIECDFVVVGIGVKPATDFVKGINLEKDGSIKVDEYLKVNENAFATGDIVTFSYNNANVRIEHWRLAEQMGRIAGFNMAGKKLKFNKQPYFWTLQSGVSFRYVGHSKDWDETITRGDIDSKDFLTFFVKNNKVEAAIGCNRDREMDAVEFLLLNNKMPATSDLRNGINIVELL
jgi:apoptosis-inducing factor 3